MREIRQSGSEGGGADIRSPYPYRQSLARSRRAMQEQGAFGTPVRFSSVACRCARRRGRRSATSLPSALRQSGIRPEGGASRAFAADAAGSGCGYGCGQLWGMVM